MSSTKNSTKPLILHLGFSATTHLTGIGKNCKNSRLMTKPYNLLCDYFHCMVWCGCPADYTSLRRPALTARQPSREVWSWWRQLEVHHVVMYRQHSMCWSVDWNHATKQSWFCSAWLCRYHFVDKVGRTEKGMPTLHHFLLSIFVACLPSRSLPRQRWVGQVNGRIFEGGGVQKRR
jgi:hypothetical protein